MLDLSIIIVSWNSKSDLQRCLGSLALSPSRAAYETIIVDNNSSDGSVEYLRQEHPDVRVIANDTNRGFAPANNQAFAGARGRYLVLLNPDTLVHKGAMDALVEFMDSHPGAGAAGPLLRNEDGTRQLTGVRLPTNWNILVEALFLDRLFAGTRFFGRHKEAYADETGFREVEYVQGSCMIVRNAIVNDLGGLDERYFMYFEEVDWCKRIRDAGWKVYVCPDAVITHFANAGVGHYDERRLIHYHRSLILFYRKHYSASSLTGLRIVLTLRSLIRIGVWVPTGIVRPELRKASLSSIKGYFRTLGLVWGGNE